MSDEAKPRVRSRAKEATAEGVDNSDEGYVFVHRTAYGDEVITTDKIRVPDLSNQLNGAQPARVRIGGGITKNLGDYNSARVDVMIELPCLPEVSEVRRVADLISAELDRLIPAELEKATSTEN